SYIAPPFLTQATIAEFIERGRFEPNLERVRAELRARRDAMLAALETCLRDGASWSRPRGGYFVWLDLGDGGNGSALAARAAEDGVGVVRGEDFFPRASGLGASFARLAFSYETPARITEGVERLASFV
ncbi:MAG: PLP-dependent aminotransferase family protein, partial [Gaiellaceae bacterium]